MKPENSPCLAANNNIHSSFPIPLQLHPHHVSPLTPARTRTQHPCAPFSFWVGRVCNSRLSGGVHFCCYGLFISPNLQTSLLLLILFYSSFLVLFWFFVTFVPILTCFSMLFARIWLFTCFAFYAPIQHLQTFPSSFAFRRFLLISCMFYTHIAFHYTPCTFNNLLTKLSFLYISSFF